MLVSKIEELLDDTEIQKNHGDALKVLDSFKKLLVTTDPHEQFPSLLEKIYRYESKKDGFEIKDLTLWMKEAIDISYKRGFNFGLANHGSQVKYKEGHTRGLTEGLAQGMVKGESQGVAKGRKLGEPQGFIAGHKEGLATGKILGKIEGEKEEKARAKSTGEKVALDGLFKGILIGFAILVAVISCALGIAGYNTIPSLEQRSQLELTANSNDLTEEVEQSSGKLGQNDSKSFTPLDLARDQTWAGLAMIAFALALLIVSNLAFALYFTRRQRR